MAVKMGRRSKVIRGRFRDRRGGLPPEIVRLLPATSKRRRSWRKYLPLWGGAVAVGLIVGTGSSLLPSAIALFGNPEQQMAAQATLEKSPPAEGRAWPLAMGESEHGLAGITTTFGFCHTGGGTNCVVDGDTIWFQGQKIRVADIDAPETHDFRCSEEKALGDRATQRLIELMNGGQVSLQSIDRDEDTYGRKLRIVMVNGVSVGDMLVGEGLARYYEGGRRPWC